jgi:selenocysteine-specific elongation factor
MKTPHPQSPSSIVLGSAGHVDHGKSSMLRTLTGMEPSRLVEEQTRGMTIELGFVWLKHSDDTVTGIVDVPGHKDFRATMISGAAGINAFLFCVAADDGWMPQSDDHLSILAALGVRLGVCVLTKTDLVAPERIAQLSIELKSRFSAALGHDIPVVPFSAQTGDGLDDLRGAVFALIESCPPQHPESEKPFFLPDRVFSLKGRGTIITGTLRHGVLREKDRVTLVPKGSTHSIKGLHCYNTAVAEARATTRVALQLSDVDHDALKHGQQCIIQGTDPSPHSSGTFDARLSYFSGLVGRRSETRRVLVLHGGLKTPARLVPAEVAGRSYARIYLETPRWIRFGDPLIILTSGADHLLAAGRVADPAPPGK